MSYRQRRSIWGFAVLATAIVAGCGESDGAFDRVEPDRMDQADGGPAVDASSAATDAASGFVDAGVAISNVCSPCVFAWDCAGAGFGATCSLMLDGLRCTAACDPRRAGGCEIGFGCVLGQCLPAGNRCTGCAISGCGDAERCDLLSGTCQPRLGRCQACSVSADCGAGLTCADTLIGRVCTDRCDKENVCAPGLGCVRGGCLSPIGLCDPCGGCPAEAPACNAFTAACTECAPGWPCPDGRVCTPNGTCVEPEPLAECLSNLDCRTPEAPYCLSGQCVDCRDRLDCAVGESCIDRICVPEPCAGLVCTGGARCDAALDRCVGEGACADDADCGEPSLRCRIETGQCYRIDQRCDPAGSGAACAQGSVCTPDALEPGSGVCTCARTNPFDPGEANERHRIPCQPGGYCLQIGDGPGICVSEPGPPPDPGPGDPCTPCASPLDCVNGGFGAACTALLDGAYCTRPCDLLASPSCEAGYTCMFGQCVPAGARCGSCATAGCVDRERCEPSSGQCGARLGRCAACERDADCEVGLTCAGTPLGRVCVDRCADDDGCAEALVCFGGACVTPAGVCDACGGCPADAPACNPATAACTACGPGWPCQIGEVCSAGGTCVEVVPGLECLSPIDCHDADAPFCVDGRCDTCRSRLDCGVGEACEDGGCIPSPCAGVRCQAGTTCDPDLNICVDENGQPGCKEDEDCPGVDGVERRCHRGTGQCYRLDQRCDADHAPCAPGSECRIDPLNPLQTVCVCARVDPNDVGEPNDAHRIPCHPGGLCLHVGGELGVCIADPEALPPPPPPPELEVCERCLFDVDCEAVGDGARCSSLLGGGMCTAACDVANPPGCARGFACMLGQCVPAGGRCDGCASTGCAEGLRCALETGQCEPRQRRCGACVNRDDCAAGLSCAASALGSVCTESCEEDGQCPGELRCVRGACLLPSGICDPCGGCPPEIPACNALTGLCTQCALDAPCRAGEVCTPAGECVDAPPGAECTSAFDCGAPRPFCVEGNCLHCRDRLDCAGGQSCVEGACVDRVCAGVECQGDATCDPERGVNACARPNGNAACREDDDCGGALRCNARTGQCYRSDQRCDLRGESSVCAPGGACRVDPLNGESGVCLCARSNSADPGEAPGDYRIPCQPAGVCLQLGTETGICVPGP